MTRLIVAAVMLVAGPLLGAVSAQPGPAPIHRIYLSAVEFKGTTTRDKLAPPPLNPSNASRGYEYKGPGDADPPLISKVTWERGREYTVYFVASQIGAYRLTCATHEPTMTATITVLPR
jgi:hypothetical protein